jgi:hypothetical protein
MSDSDEASTGETTEFQIHVKRSQNIIDFTEQKLLSFVKRLKDPKQQEKVEEVLNLYRSGNIAISWNKGMPAWLKIR